MKLIKFSSIFLLSFLFVLFISELSAGRHTRTSFSMNFNVDARPRYCSYNYVAQPLPPPAVVAPVAYPYPYYREVVVPQPYVERVYVQPQYTYYPYWGY